LREEVSVQAANCFLILGEGTLAWIIEIDDGKYVREQICFSMRKPQRARKPNKLRLLAQSPRLRPSVHLCRVGPGIWIPEGNALKCAPKIPEAIRMCHKWKVSVTEAACHDPITSSSFVDRIKKLDATHWRYRKHLCSRPSRVL
jgi:hypothetical protein